MKFKRTFVAFMTSWVYCMVTDDIKCENTGEINPADILTKKDEFRFVLQPGTTRNAWLFYL